MKKKSFKKSVIVFSVLLILLYGVTMACYDEGFDYRDISDFTPETSCLDNSYKPLFLSSSIFYGDDYNVNCVSLFNDGIVKEWGEYLGEEIRISDLSYFLLDSESQKDINLLYKSVVKKQKDPKWSNRINTNDEKVKNFILFMNSAKDIEKIATQPSDPWSYEPANKPFVDSQLINQVEKEYYETHDLFLKNRFWFQTVKAKFYSSNKQNAIDFFQKTESQIPKNTLYYRALSYVAGAYYQQKDYAKSNYLYSVVFNKCIEMRTVATYNFHPQEQADFNASLNMASSIEEKSALWALFGYYADEKQAISEIYKLDPKNINLEFLLTRLINKEEFKLNTKEFKDASSYKATIKTDINRDIYILVNRIAKEENTSKPYLWNLAAGYLNILSGNADIAGQFIERARVQAPETDLLMSQIKLLKLINSLFKITILNSDVENDLLSELNWLNIVCPQEAEIDFRYEHALEWSKQYISSLYENQNNILYKEIFHPDQYFYRDQSNLEAMKQFLAKPNKSKWEKFTTNIYSVSLSDIYEYQGVVNAYSGNLAQAVNYMKQSDHSGDTLLGNPFQTQIKDCHDCDHEQLQETKYTKLSFLEKANEIQTNIERGLDLYNNFLLLGNAFYNISYYGNARKFYYGIIMNQYSNLIDLYYQPLLLNSSKAKAYYQKSLDVATNAEQKAKCLYLIAKCERNEFYAKKHNVKNELINGQDIDFLAWGGFKKLKAEYANTNYYKEVINQCGYFKEYLKIK